MENRTPIQIPRTKLRLAVKEREICVAPEATVEYHVGVINFGTLEDIISLSVKGVPPEWVSFDEKDLYVAPGKVKQTILRVTPPPFPEGRVGYYKLKIQGKSPVSPNQPLTAESTLVIAAYRPGGRVGVLIGAIDFPIIPGSSISIPLLLENRGTTDDSFRLSITGIPEAWVSTTSRVTKLGSLKSQEIIFNIHMPRTSAAIVGRRPFKIQVSSDAEPSKSTQIDCIFTVAAFSKFMGELRPNQIQANQPAQLLINNEGNTVDTYSLGFRDSSTRLLFEKITRFRQIGDPDIKLAYSEITFAQKLRIPAGELGVFEFRSKLRTRPIVGSEQVYPFKLHFFSTERQPIDLSSQISEKGSLPPWVVSVFLIGFLFLCLILFIPQKGEDGNVGTTQTASYNQTQTAIPIVSEEDDDGDGLPNNKEFEIGTDYLNPDSDADGLKDGEELITYKTDPMLVDTDRDGASDGAEILSYKSNPLIPDTDGDLLRDGDEITYQTNPLIPDTDADGLNDGAEISNGTNPLLGDTDGDGLMDGQENQICPHPLNLDTDGDTIADGTDLEPCDKNNLFLTATAIANIPTNTPTQTATEVPPTTPPVPTATKEPSPNVNGLIVFESDRDGNSEIYLLNAFDQKVTRITDNEAKDNQPSLAPNALEIAYVTDQDGNNEIYLTGVDRRTPVNLTENVADDQHQAWSPDGQWLAFTSNRDGNQEVYVVRNDGSELRNLTNNASNDFLPSWYSTLEVSGIQEWIVFTSNRDGNQEVYKVKPDGSELANLTNNTANDHSPAGFINGNLITFVSDRDGNSEIYMMTTDGSSQANITNHAGQDIEPAFKSDGEWITFSTNRDGDFEIYIMRRNGTNIYNMTREPKQDHHPDWR